MREGSLDAPVRHPVPWRDADFYDEAKLDEELRRVFDICHGCRRCFNLCDSFPRLFDLIDESKTGELDSVDSKGFKPVTDACTLCDMCFMTKCPYVPPHEFNLDFPHLMLRVRAVEWKKGQVKAADKQLAETDRNGRMGTALSGPANWACKTGNHLTRPAMQAAAGVHRDAYLPAFAAKPFTKQAADAAPKINREAPGFGRKVALYATCYGEYNDPDIAAAAHKVLAHNGVETEAVYLGCCGMPQLEQGDIARVAETARKTAEGLRAWIDKGYAVVPVVSSCALMMKFEWPLLVPDDENVKALSAAVYDVSEYVMDIAKQNGLAEGLKPVEGGVTVHIACHARAQNNGQKAAEMLKLIPDTPVKVIERCSGHGGSWGVKKEWFETALKVGKPVAREAEKAASAYVVSECPLARDHILQGIEKLSGAAPAVRAGRHPVQVLAAAYGL
ncbi:MAG: (Fe-S)-binding protein [Rhodospirillales bacterium]